MSKKEVGVIFKAYDQASHAMSNVGRGVKDIAKDLNRLESSARSMQRAVHYVLGSAGLYAMGRFLAGTVRSARDAAESENLFTVSLQDNATAARGWSRDVGEALRLNQYTLRENVGTLNAMFDSLGLGAEHAYEMSKALTVLSRDMASFYNQRPDEAFQKLQAGISGEVEPLKRLGIVVNETTVKEFALRQGWIQHGQTLSEVGKIYARYGVIVEQTEKAQGDLARTADSAANVQRSLTEAWQEQKVLIGQELLPAYASIAKALRDSSNQTGQFVRQQVEGLLTIWETADWIRRGIAGENRMPDSYRKAAIEQYRFHVDFLDPDAFRTEMQATGLEGERPPKYPQKWQQILEQHIRAWERDQAKIVDPRLAELRRRAEALSVPPVVQPDGVNMVADTGLKAENKAVQKYTDDVANAYRRMYSDMKLRTEESFRGRMAILQAERGEYGKFIEDKALLDAWYEERRQQLEIERAKAGENFWEGGRAGLQEMQREMDTLGQLGADYARTLRDGLADGFTDAILQARSLQEVMRGLLNDMARLGLNWMARQMFTDILGSLAGGLGGGTVPAGDMNPPMANIAHAGGLVGYTAFPRRSVARGVFAGAPRLHNGLRADEFPAILQKGEQVIPRGGGAPTVLIDVKNYGQEKDVTKTEPQWNGDAWVIGVILNDLDHGGVLSERLG